MSRLDELWERTDMTTSEMCIAYRKVRCDSISAHYKQFKLDVKKMVYEISNTENEENLFNNYTYFKKNIPLQLIRRARGEAAYNSLVEDIKQLAMDRAILINNVKIDIGLNPLLNEIDIEKYGLYNSKVEGFIRVNEELVNKIIQSKGIIIESVSADTDENNKNCNIRRTRHWIRFAKEEIEIGYYPVTYENHEMYYTLENEFRIRNGALYIQLPDDNFYAISELNGAQRMRYSIAIEYAEIAVRALYDYLLQVTKDRETEKKQTSIIHTIRVADIDIDIDIDDNIIYKPIEDIVPNKIVTYDKPIGTHSSPVPHDVRGHLRHYKNGKVVFIKGYHKSSPKYTGSRNNGKTMIGFVN